MALLGQRHESLLYAPDGAIVAQADRWRYAVNGDSPRGRDGEGRGALAHRSPRPSPAPRRTAKRRRPAAATHASAQAPRKLSATTAKAYEKCSCRTFIPHLTLQHMVTLRSARATALRLGRVRTAGAPVGSQPTEVARTTRRR